MTEGSRLANNNRNSDITTRPRRKFAAGVWMVLASVVVAAPVFGQSAGSDADREAGTPPGIAERFSVARDRRAKQHQPLYFLYDLRRVSGRAGLGES